MNVEKLDLENWKTSFDILIIIVLLNKLIDFLVHSCPFKKNIYTLLLSRKHYNYFYMNF